MTPPGAPHPATDATPRPAAPPPPPPTAEDIDRLAPAPSLLIASDFDGTLSPLVPDPESAAPLPESAAAIRALAALPSTRVAIISGRDLASLTRVLNAPAGIALIGSHGAEPSVPSDAPAPPPEAHDPELLGRVADLLQPFVDATPGSFLERKPYGVAFHHRTSDPAAAARAVSGILGGPALLRGVHIRTGSLVLELSTSPATKAAAFAALRERLKPAAVIFLGDDDTDEQVFATLGPDDVSIRIGPGSTRASRRVPDPAAAATFLTMLARARAAHAAGIPGPGVPEPAHAAFPDGQYRAPAQIAVPVSAPAAPYPIERLSLLSDQRTIALITHDANVVWLCLPRIDSPALFSQLLGGPLTESRAGHFSIAPSDGAPPLDQSYEGDTFVLRTRFPSFSITDYFDCSGGRPYQRAGRTDLLRCVEGSGRVRIVFAPRLDFSRSHTRLAALDGGLEITGAPDPVVLHAPGVPWVISDDGPHQTATAEFDLSSLKDGMLTLELRYGVRNLRQAPTGEPHRRQQTRRFWQTWADTLIIPPGTPAARLVKRSALVLKALCYAPTGAIAAAGTTSLPEALGGVRNWDYRCCWPRDAAYAAAALVRLGNTGQAMKLLDWVLSIVEELPSPDRLRPVYAVTGHELGPEAEISELPGYADSRPVRVGNAASTQVQLDVFGPIVELVSLLAQRDAPITPEYWRLVEHMVSAVAARWRGPDHGIWEFRTSPRHHVHSRVMCWLTADRALAVAEQYLGRSREDWRSLREQIRADVLTHGFRPEVGAFTLAYDSPVLDAAALQVGLSGLLPADDPRFISTVNAVHDTLREGPTVYRYRCDDGLPGSEGGFHICAAWLAESLWMIGRRDEAESLLESLVALAGPTGLFPEQFDPRAGISLGNHPQAYSHLGLINTALRLGARG